MGEGWTAKNKAQLKQNKEEMEDRKRRKKERDADVADKKLKKKGCCGKKDKNFKSKSKIARKKKDKCSGRFPSSFRYCARVFVFVFMLCATFATLLYGVKLSMEEAEAENEDLEATLLLEEEMLAVKTV